MKVTNSFGIGVVLCITIFLLTIDLEKPLPLNFWQYVLIILGGLCYIIYVILNIKEKKWFWIFSCTLAILVLCYCLYLLLTPIPA